MVSESLSSVDLIQQYRAADNGYMVRRGKFGQYFYQHRDVWENHNGPIPDGHHIHHKNKNRHDNRIENLECIEAEAHLRMHGMSPEMIGHLSKARQSMPLKEYDCIACEKRCISRHPLAKFCGLTCRRKYKNWLFDTAKSVRRLNVRKDRECLICKKVFTPSDSKGVYCSQKCTRKSVYQPEKERRALNRVSISCLVCANPIMEAKRSNKIYCSPKCMRVGYKLKLERINNLKTYNV